MKRSGWPDLAGKFLRGICLAVTVNGFAVSCAVAEQRPLWEVGAGVATINFPDYRGSNERQTYILPLPYVIYRGDFLKIDRQRVRGLLFQGKQAELDISVNGSVPVKSDVARQGMSDLDPTFEIGPSLNVSLYKAESAQTRVELRLPLRSVLGVSSSHIRHVGWLFQPQLNVDVENVFNQAGWNMGMAIGPLFTDRRYNQYFYGVAPAYSRADRPAYQTGGGYAGSQFVAALSKRYPGFWVGGFVKLDTLRGAAFEASPLVKSKQYATAGFGISWIFAASSGKVEESN